MNQVENYFSVEPISEDIEKNKIRKALDSADAGDIVFYVYFGQGRGCFIKIKEKTNMLPLLATDESEELMVLDVAQLHTIILKNILNIDTKEPNSQKYVTYKVDMIEALSRVDSGEFDLAFFMNATHVSDVRNLAEKGVRLPQKATFFYPKLLSGLVINKFDS